MIATINSVCQAPLTLDCFHTKTAWNAPFWPTVSTEPLSYPASNEDYCKRKHYSVYTMPFSHENVSITFSYENDIV